MAVEDTILAMLEGRAGTMCPSEVARALDPDDWRPRMDEVRAAAAALVASGDIEVTQGGEVVDLATVRGPIRLRKTGTKGTGPTAPSAPNA